MGNSQQRHHHPLPSTWLHDLGRLFFPHLCAGCGNSSLPRAQAICHRCMSAIPETGFAAQENNPVEMLFWGRLKVAAAGSHCYYTRASTIQRIMHELKYKGNHEAGRVLGRMLGDRLQNSPRFNGMDAIVPMPLYPDKEKIRGYNQAVLIGQGVREILGIPVIENAVLRTRATGSQTRKNRMERWQNVTGVFRPEHQTALIGKSILLVDDVVTTGASLEACGQAVLQAGAAELRIATVAYAE